MALPEVVSPQEELKAVSFRNPSSQHRRRTSNGGNMAACPDITFMTVRPSKTTPLFG
jgi:hypothetical protein